jgi:hypothetical protein
VKSDSSRVLLLLFINFLTAHQGQPVRLKSFSEEKSFFQQRPSSGTGDIMCALLLKINPSQMK